MLDELRCPAMFPPRAIAARLPRVHRAFLPVFLFLRRCCAGAVGATGKQRSDEKKCGDCDQFIFHCRPSMQAVYHKRHLILNQLIGISLHLGDLRSVGSSAFQDWDFPFRFRDEKSAHLNKSVHSARSRPLSEFAPVEFQAGHRSEAKFSASRWNWKSDPFLEQQSWTNRTMTKPALRWTPV